LAHGMTGPALRRGRHDDFSLLPSGEGFFAASTEYVNFRPYLPRVPTWNLR
jgi:hypothetical protein